MTGARRSRGACEVERLPLGCALLPGMPVEAYPRTTDWTPSPS